jgi:hypothetical protein
VPEPQRAKARWWWVEGGLGRTAPCAALPAQNPAGGFPAPGSPEVSPEDPSRSDRGMDGARYRREHKPGAGLQHIPAQLRLLPSVTKRPPPLEPYLMPNPLELRLAVGPAEVLVEAPEHQRQVLLLIEPCVIKARAATP